MYCWLGTRIKRTLANYHGQMKQRIQTVLQLHPLKLCTASNDLRQCNSVVYQTLHGSHLARRCQAKKTRHPQQKPDSRLHSCVKQLYNACMFRLLPCSKKSSTFRNTLQKWIIKLWLIVSSKSWKDCSQTVAVWLAWAQSKAEYDNQWLTTTICYLVSLTC